MRIDIKILATRILEKGLAPKRQTSGAAGYDLHAMTNEEINICPNETAILIPTGIAIHIKDDRYYAMILPRSSVGHKHGLVLGNTVGLIDSDYQGEIFLSVFNRGT